jgi:flagellar biosynthesis protein FliR
MSLTSRQHKRPITANLLNIIMLLSFFAVNGHHRLFYMLYESLDKMPIGGIVLNTK